MKKSTVAIISSLCTLLVCLAVFLISNNGTNTPAHKQKEIVFEHKKTAVICIDTAGHTKDTDEKTLQKELKEVPGTQKTLMKKTLQKELKEVLSDKMFLHKMDTIHADVNYDISLHRVKNTNLFKISFRSDTEKLSREVCNFVVDELCKKAEDSTELRCFVVDYAS